MLLRIVFKDLKIILMGMEFIEKSLFIFVIILVKYLWVVCNGEI